MSEIKVGDRVKVVKTAMFNGDRMGKTGTVERIRASGNLSVKFDDGGEDYGYRSDLELITPSAPSAALKIGDRVKVIKGAVFRFDSIDKVGTIVRFHNDNKARPVVKFDNGGEDWGRADEVELITPARLIPDEITIDGEKYRRVVEVKEPEKPEPEAGQVWKTPHTNQFVILIDRDQSIFLRSGECGSWSHAQAVQWGTFIAPSLADALEQGLLKPSDLR